MSIEPQEPFVPDAFTAPASAVRSILALDLSFETHCPDCHEEYVVTVTRRGNKGPKIEGECSCGPVYWRSASNLKNSKPKGTSNAQKSNQEKARA